MVQPLHLLQQHRYSQTLRLLELRQEVLILLEWSSIQGGLILLGAILIGAMSGNSDVVEAGAMVAPSIMSQNQIDFTRDMEVEADAIGIKTLGLAR